MTTTPQIIRIPAGTPIEVAENLNKARRHAIAQRKSAILAAAPNQSDEEILATITCMKRHDDEATETAAEQVDTVIVFDGTGLIQKHALSRTLKKPAPQCVRNELRKREFLTTAEKV